MTAVMRYLTGTSLTQRALRSSAITMLGFGAGQVARLASNLILTRLLFPEAFGVMAMVSVFIMGLSMFSDVGVAPAIMQSKRGDDRAFLDTAWTIQLCRGVGLWLTATALAWPVARYFGEPDLVQYLPVAAFALVISGFNPTKLETAHRHMQAGRVTLIELATQITGIVAAGILAWIYQSVWALVISGVFSALAHLIYLRTFLPGPQNRLRWEPEAAGELIHFGKWIFLSTVAGFAIGQSDKVIIGGWLSTYDFGIYNIGFFLASFPLMLGSNVTRRVLIPIYRESPPSKSRANFLRLRAMRMPATAMLLCTNIVLSCAGVWLVQLLYDSRYHEAGGIVVLIAVMQIPSIIALTYDQAALAAGESRPFFVLAATRAVLVIGLMIVGLQVADLPGALIGQGLAAVLAYPVVVWLARRQGAWDPTHDACFAILGILGGAFALWLNGVSVADLWQVRAG